MMVFDHSDGEGPVQGDDCPECEGNGEVVYATRQDRFTGVWDADTFTCILCGGTGSIDAAHPEQARVR